MRRLCAIVLATAAVAATVMPAAPAAGASFLTVRAAKHALRVNLARAFGIHHVRASCTRRSRVKLSCRWRGRREGVPYRGDALIVRSGRSIVVRLSHVHRA
jgi:hypothetical protein